MVQFLKFLGSYFWDVPVEIRCSRLNPCLKVNISSGRLVLDSATVNYSFGSLHTIFAKTFRKIGLYRKQVNNCLVLGFGAGSIASILKHHYPAAHITGVEADPVVIELARKYFNLDKMSDLQLIIDDAMNFIAQVPGPYDLIAVDVYLDHIMPGKIASEEFYCAVKKSLSKEGILVMNRCILNYEERFHTGEEIKIFRKVFEQGYHLVVCNNLMLINQLIIKECAG